MGRKSVVDLVREWQPKKWYRGRGAHNKFRDDLCKFLDKRLNVNVTTESRKARADIEVGNNTAVEVKRNVKDRSKVKSATADVDEYMDYYSTIIVVVCGGKDMYFKKLRKALQKKFDKQSPIQQKIIKLIIKKKGDKREKSIKSKRKRKSPLEEMEDSLDRFGLR